jgi:hypothetical protein
MDIEKSSISANKYVKAVPKFFKSNKQPHRRIYMLRSIICVLLFVLTAIYILLFVVTSSGMSDPFVGEFVANAEDDKYYLKIEKTPDGKYQGVILVDGEQIRLTGQRRGEGIMGEINEDGEIYQFMAKVNKDGSLYLEDEDGESMIFQPTHTADLGRPSNDDLPSPENSKSGQSPAKQREVYINRIKLDADKLQMLETIYQVHIDEGKYWYDGNCGAWGVEGGPTVGFIMAGLDLPGPMPSDISGGGTAIFINGREIHPLDQQGLHQLFGVTYPGRYWLDAQGNLGLEGGLPIVNIVATIRAAQSKQAGKSVTHGYGSTFGGRGTLAGDGQGGHIYSGRTATGKSVFWYPGM